MRRIREYNNLEKMLRVTVWKNEKNNTFDVTGLNLSGMKHIEYSSHKFNTLIEAITFALSQLED